MHTSDEVEALPQLDMKEYRKQYKREHDEFRKTVTKENIVGIEDVIVKAPSVDMKVLRGMNPEFVKATIDRFFANDGR